MGRVSSREADRRRDMVTVAKAFYQQGKSKLEIADETGMSRFMVARLLGEAQAVGLVTITINVGEVLPDNSQALAAHLGLARASVVEVYG
ncbi:MAG: hypothetical protein LBI33_14285, partial [Propionibacteriaceae bacterium]|nr:hypothetical protein [Propionibacteriaceae bacterium]